MSSEDRLERLYRKILSGNLYWRTEASFKYPDNIKEHGDMVSDCYARNTNAQ